MNFKLKKLSAAMMLTATLGMVAGCNTSEQSALTESADSQTADNNTVTPETKTAGMRIALRFPQYEQAQASFIYDNVASYDIKVESVYLPTVDSLKDPVTGEFYDDYAARAAGMIDFITRTDVTENQIKQALYQDEFKGRFYATLFYGFPTYDSFGSPIYNNAFSVIYDQNITPDILGVDNTVSIANLTPGLYVISVVQKDALGNRLAATRMLANLGEGQNDIVMTMMDADWKTWDVTNNTVSPLALTLATDPFFDWDPTTVDVNEPAFNFASLAFSGITNYAMPLQQANVYGMHDAYKAISLQKDGVDASYVLPFFPESAYYSAEELSYLTLEEGAIGDPQTSETYIYKELNADEVQYYDYRVQTGSKIVAYLSASVNAELFSPEGYQAYRARFVDSEFIAHLSQATLDSATNTLQLPEITGFEWDYLGRHQGSDGNWVTLEQVFKEVRATTVNNTTGLDLTKLTVPHVVDGATLVGTVVEMLEQTSVNANSGQLIANGGSAILAGVENNNVTLPPDQPVQIGEQPLNVCTTFNQTITKEVVYFYKTQDANGQSTTVILTPKDGVNPYDTNTWPDTNSDGIKAWDEAFDVVDNAVQETLSMQGKVCFYNITLKASALSMNYTGITVQ